MQALLLTKEKNKVVQELLEDSPHITFDGECLWIRVGKEVEFSLSKTQLFARGWEAKRDLNSPFARFTRSETLWALWTEGRPQEPLYLRKEGALYSVSFAHWKATGIASRDLFQSCVSALETAANAWELESADFLGNLFSFRSF